MIKTKQNIFNQPTNKQTNCNFINYSKSLMSEKRGNFCRLISIRQEFCLLKTKPQLKTVIKAPQSSKRRRNKSQCIKVNNLR